MRRGHTHLVVVAEINHRLVLLVRLVPEEVDLRREGLEDGLSHFHRRLRLMEATHHSDPGGVDTSTVNNSVTNACPATSPFSFEAV